MFRRLLVANRGEVAVRIARAARQLGVAPVGVSSTADLGASWLEAFEQVVTIGGPAPRESYLRGDVIVQAALQTGCAAVHPGWGFLSESPNFAALCEQHGLTFVGPTAGVMQRMALKWPAKDAMRQAGLELLPGSEGLLSGVEEARAMAEIVGYPVLLKADSGGGGRGMRRVEEPAGLEDAYNAARAEAESAFGDGALYLERFLTGGRHIEVQLLADRFGNVIHLHERECSIQRRNQKLIEESPSPALSPAQRLELGEGAARAAASIGYRGAGTIEFLRHPGDGRLTFMEMNTRLQVEHPVTELVTGVDIVQEQLRLAANAPLSLQTPPLEGAAIECRINAEDPRDDFRPTPGTLTSFEFPREHGPGSVRVDTHLRAGDLVSPYYDSLLAKVIAHAPTREEAIDTMIRALSAASVTGVETTIPLHLAVLDSAEFRSGTYDTSRLPGWSAPVR